MVGAERDARQGVCVASRCPEDALDLVGGVGRVELGACEVKRVEGKLEPLKDKGERGLIGRENAVEVLGAFRVDAVASRREEFEALAAEIHVETRGSEKGPSRAIVRLAAASLSCRP